MDSEIIVAADLGNAKLAVMAAKKFADGKLEILALESEPTPQDSIRNGIITKPSEVAARLSMMLKLLANRIKLPIYQFYVGVNGRSLRTVRVNVPRIFGHNEEISKTYKKSNALAATAAGSVLDWYSVCSGANGLYCK